MTMLRTEAGAGALDELARLAMAARRAIERGRRPWAPVSRDDQAAYDALVEAAGAANPDGTAVAVATHAACWASWYRRQAARTIGIGVDDLADAAAERSTTGPVIESTIGDWITGRSRRATAWRTAALRATQQAARMVGDLTGLGEAGGRHAMAVASGTGSPTDLVWVATRASRAGIATTSPRAAAEALLRQGRRSTVDPAATLDAIPDPGADPADLIVARDDDAALVADARHALDALDAAGHPMAAQARREVEAVLADELAEPSPMVAQALRAILRPSLVAAA